MLSAARSTYMHGFELDNGYKPLHVVDLKRWLDCYEYASPYRVFLLLLTATAGRPTEIEHIRWFDFTKDVILYRPKKHHHKVTRRVKVPPKIMRELEDYKQDNFFRHGYLFNFRWFSVKDDLNHRLREILGGYFQVKDPMPYSGQVKEKGYYSMRSIRVTIATLVFFCFSKEYGREMALSRTCSWLGHRSEKMTADHYVKHLHRIGIEKLPSLPTLELLDWIVYHETQKKIQNYEYQEKIIQFGR